MPDDDRKQKRGVSDATDYSSTKAPETQQEAEQSPTRPSDPRLVPGGLRGTAADPGMSSLDRDVATSGGTSPRQQDVGSSEDRDRG